MFTRLVLIVICAMLSACVATPKGTPSVTAYKPLGLPLSATESIAFFVSTEVSQPPTPSAKPSEIYRINNLGAVVQGFTKGFRAVRPNAPIVVADEVLQRACFESGTKSVESGGAVLVAPNFTAPQCRELLKQRAIRYLVSVAGSRDTLSHFKYDVFSIEYEHNHTFTLVARAFETTSGSSVCEHVETAFDVSLEGAIMYYFIFPIPGIRALDETGYWERVAWQAGAQIGGCFVQPVGKN